MKPLGFAEGLIAGGVAVVTYSFLLWLITRWFRRPPMQ